MPWLQRLRQFFRRDIPIAGLWLPWIGGALLVWAAVSGARSWQATRGLTRTAATVTENAATFAPGGGVQYVPRLRFRLPAGEIVLAMASSGSEEIEYSAGESLPVLYPATNPQHARIATFWSLYSTAILLTILGIVVLDLGLVFRLIAAKNNR